MREIINCRCHPTDTDTGDLDLGLVTLVLILNRLLAPTPLVHVERWVAGTVLPDLLGIDAAQGNDDRLARGLDALVPHLDVLLQELVVAAVVLFDLDLRQLCYDITSLCFCATTRALGGIPSATVETIGRIASKSSWPRR